MLMNGGIMRTALRIIGLATGLLLAGMTCGIAQSGTVGTTGTAAEARAMLEKAVAALKSDERTAIAKFLNPIGGFIDRDLHVFCYDTRNGEFTAYTTYRMLGVDIRTMQEKDGFPLGQRIFDANKPDTIVTVDFNAPRPGESQPVPKQVVITIVGHQGCGVSYYK
jgi:hypothetical protein